MTMDRRFRNTVLTAAALTVFAGCALGNPGETEYYGSFELKAAQTSDLVSVIESVSNRLDIAIRDLDDGTVVDALNDLVRRGVTVNLVLDNENYLVTNDLIGAVNIVAGNKYGAMDSNFLIKDGETVVQLSTSRLTNAQFLMMTIVNIYAAEDYEAEFEQMFAENHFGSGSDVETPKQRANFRETYTIGRDTVGVYFLPAQPFLEQISERVGSMRHSTQWYLSDPQNQFVYDLWGDVLNSGVTDSIVLGVNYLSNKSDFPNFYTGVHKTIVLDDFRFDAMFFDVGTLYQTVVLTSCELGDHQTMIHGDGVCVTVTGPDVQGIYDLVSGLESGKPATNVAVSFSTPLKTVPYTNIIINEIVRKGIKDDSGTSYALAKMIELRNLTPDLIDLTGYRVIITNGNRTSEPATFIIPSGTLLQPNGYYVIAAESYAYKYYDVLWFEFYIDSSFTVTLEDSRGEVIDHVGQVYYGSTNSWTVASSYTYSMQRKTSLVGGSLDLGTNQSSWQASTVNSNMFDNFNSGTKVTPGAY